MGKVFGIIGLICGILGLIFPWIPAIGGLWTITFPILAIVFGAIGIAKDDSKALGIVGLIFGILGLIFWILAIFILAALLAALFGGLFP